MYWTKTKCRFNKTYLNGVAERLKEATDLKMFLKLWFGQEMSVENE